MDIDTNEYIDRALARCGASISEAQIKTVGNYQYLCRQEAKKIARNIISNPAATEEQQAEAAHYIARAHWLRYLETPTRQHSMPFEEYLATWADDGPGVALRATRPQNNEVSLAELIRVYYWQWVATPRARLKPGYSCVFQD